MPSTFDPMHTAVGALTTATISLPRYQRRPYEGLAFTKRPVILHLLVHMDAAVLTKVFRDLFARPARKCLRRHAATSWIGFPALSLQQRRSYATRRKQDDAHGGSKWQQRIDAFPKDMSSQLREYPKVTSHDLRHRAQRPTRVKMLTRDFIEGMQFQTYYREHH